MTLSNLLNAATTSKNIFDAFKKGFENASGAGITLTNNEIKDTMKVIKSLENREILLKGTTRKITSLEEGF